MRAEGRDELGSREGLPGPADALLEHHLGLDLLLHVRHRDAPGRVVVGVVEVDGVELATDRALDHRRRRAVFRDACGQLGLLPVGQGPQIELGPLVLALVRLVVFVWVLVLAGPLLFAERVLWYCLVVGRAPAKTAREGLLEVAAACQEREERQRQGGSGERVGGGLG
ncbi:hypothetical protein PPSIR1_28243 [Plesiocystis pacifica SIR-1]|uniref:Uncharacterized protein n=1 Tax=Plesiocystis pacifica SIR-1 TaxID=391625 RepID=A6FZS1_9BACT|nr:hypothetical protein PPSIR1_28243 [Plesiocystis pacifica SIR-1]